MVAFLQLAGLAIFAAAFFMPIFWCWGHGVGVFLFVLGSYLHNQNRARKKMHREMMKAMRGR